MKLGRQWMSKRFLLLAVVSVSVALAADAGQQKHHRVRFGGVMIGAGYTHYSGYPYFGYPYYGFYPDYLYDPFFWGPFYAPGYYTGFAYQPGLGDVKIQVPDRSATVYLDGAYAGQLADLKNMWLVPGVYHLEVRAGQSRLTQKIYVLSGKTLKISSERMNREALE
jgi:hypothetical protein